MPSHRVVEIPVHMAYLCSASPAALQLRHSFTVNVMIDGQLLLGCKIHKCLGLFHIFAVVTLITLCEDIFLTSAKARLMVVLRFRLELG